MSIDWDAELAKVHLPEDEEDKPKERTPEDTKRALHCCLVENEDVCECDSCPYAVNGSSTWNCDVSVGQDALAYIEQLEQRVPRWISVEERLPESGKHVLAAVWFSGQFIRGGYVCDGFFARRFSISSKLGDELAYEYCEEKDEHYLEEGWYEVIKNWDDYDSVAIADRVTHWMPLPEPPEEE